MKKINGRAAISNTGILFFSKEPSKFIKQNEIRMVCYSGTTKTEIIDSLYINSTFLDMFKHSETFFKRNTRNAIKFDGFERYNISEYPYTAIREAIVNAISHRDYNISGSVISFNIFSDRIEIISLGRLVPPLTIDDLGEVPVHRNESICNLLRETDYMERAGSGINRMRKEMKPHGLDIPHFSEPGEFFKVVFQGPGGKIMELTPTNGKDVIDLEEEYNLKDRQLHALELMANSKVIMTVKHYENRFNVSNSTALGDLKELVNLGLIVRGKLRNRRGFGYIVR